MPFGCRHSLLGHPMPAEELGSPCGRLTERPDGAPGPRRGYRVPHARATTGVGALYTPRTAVPFRSRDVLDRRLPLFGGQSLHLAPASHLAGLRFTRHQRGFKQFARPVFPSPAAARMERAPLRLPPEASAPRRPRADDARQGRGQAVEHGPGTTRSTSHPLILQSVVHSFRATSRRTVHLESLGISHRTLVPLAIRERAVRAIESSGVVRAARRALDAGAQDHLPTNVSVCGCDSGCDGAGNVGCPRNRDDLHREGDPRITQSGT